jgi:ribosomal protein S18 acetylase RimI-like enzyme
MNSEIIIRQSNVNDSQKCHELLLLIADLHKKGRPDVFEGLVSKYTLDQVKERLSSEDNGVFVAESDGAVVGYVFCDIIKEGSGLTLYIDDLCVDPSARKKGVATALMNYASDYGKEKGCRMLMLNVWEFNSSAISFYENFGFETRSRHLEKMI